MSITMEIKGLEKFRRGLQDLPQRLAKRIMNRAVKYAAFVLEEEIKTNTPADSGQMRESVVTKMKNISPWEVSAIVGTVPKDGNKAAYNAPLLEYGFRYVIKSGLKVLATGLVPPNAFMRRSFEQQRENMQQIIVDEISEAAQKEWKRLNG